MTKESARLAQFTADVQMRLVIRESSYAAIGALMDAVVAAMNEVIGADPNARFDFTGFNTHPCKATQMDQLAYAEMPTVASQVYEPTGF